MSCSTGRPTGRCRSRPGSATSSSRPGRRTRRHDRGDLATRATPGTRAPSRWPGGPPANDGSPGSYGCRSCHAPSDVKRNCSYGDAATTAAPVLQSARPRMANAFQTLKSIVILSLELTSLATDQGWFATVAGLYLSPVGRGHEQSAPSPALARLGEGRLMFARSRSRGMLTNRAQSRTDRELHRKAPCSGRGPPLKRESRPYGWAVT